MANVNSEASFARLNTLQRRGKRTNASDETLEESRKNLDSEMNRHLTEIDARRDSQKNERLFKRSIQKNKHQKRGVSGGKSAALGGAISGALQGEGVGGIAKKAFSYYLLYIAFGLLPTLLGSIPALVYLDIHYIMSKFGIKFFTEMLLWQKLTLAVTNVLAMILVFVIVGASIQVFELAKLVTDIPIIGPLIETLFIGLIN